MFIFLTASLSSCTGWNVCNVVAFIVLNYSRMLLLGNTRRTLRRRPATLGTQFKISIGALLNTLSTKKCHYIRCIKPNENRMPRVFDINLVQHQIRYLGYVNPMTILSLIGQNPKKFSFYWHDWNNFRLVELSRLRRHGFAFRETYGAFLSRFKMLCHHTWPSWHGPSVEVNPRKSDFFLLKLMLLFSNGFKLIVVCHR